MNISSNINFFLGLQSQIKIMHWQTVGYARHKAFDETLDELYDLVDSFVEEAMGKYGRFELEDKDKTIKLSNLSDIDVKGMIDTVCDALIQYTDQFEETDTNLLNIRDEMLGLFNKLKYLITLE
jgi:DNA-binding ferritin-like protein